MRYESQESVALEFNEAIPAVNNKNYTLRKIRIKKFMLNKVLPAAAHIISLLIGGGIMIIFSYFVE